MVSLTESAIGKSLGEEHWLLGVCVHVVCVRICGVFVFAFVVCVYVCVYTHLWCVCGVCVCMYVFVVHVGVCVRAHRTATWRYCGEACNTEGHLGPWHIFMRENAWEEPLLSSGRPPI